MHTLPLTHAGGSGVVYGDAIAYRRTAGEQEGECEGEDPFHFVSALSAALCDIFNFVNTIELCHFEVSTKALPETSCRFLRLSIGTKFSLML